MCHSPNSVSSVTRSPETGESRESSPSSRSPGREGCRWPRKSIAPFQSSERRGLSLFGGHNGSQRAEGSSTVPETHREAIPDCSMIHSRAENTVKFFFQRHVLWSWEFESKRVSCQGRAEGVLRRATWAPAVKSLSPSRGFRALTPPQAGSIPKATAFTLPPRSSASCLTWDNTKRIQSGLG